MQSDTITQAPSTGPNAALLAEHEYITEKEVMHVGRFSRSTLNRIPPEKLPRYKFGGKTLYRSTDVKALLANLPVAGQ